MNRELVLDQHIIEAWGLWWVQWQNDMKTTLRQGYSAEPMSSRVNRFAELHLSDGATSRESLGRNTTASPKTNLTT